MKHNLNVKSVDYLTHDVLRIVLEKPGNLEYQPGQAVDFAINKDGWQNEIRPFTFTSLPEDEDIEFTIKTYPAHKGVTNELLNLKKGDRILLDEVFGTILYKGEGMFIAGGAGVTPFIAILKNLEKKNELGNNKLLFANKSKQDIILKEHFEKMLGKNFINVLSDDDLAEYEHGFITADIIKKYSDSTTKYYYICGPEPMMDAMEKNLESLGVDKEAIVKEAF